MTGYRQPMWIALYQPDQPGNVGTILRLGACLGIAVHIIEPCGFAYADRALRRAGMDYAQRVAVVRHKGWEDFKAATQCRVVLLTTRGDLALPKARFEADDILLFGSESHGVPSEVHAAVDLRVRIPQAGNTRSLNIAVAAGIALATALQQTGGWPQ